MTAEYYKLGGPDGRTPILCSEVLEWAAWFETADRHVAISRVGPYVVSTVFLGLDHDWSTFATRDPLTYQPLIYETMAYLEMKETVPAIPEIGIPERESTHHFVDEQERCRTWEAAELQHAAMVDKLKEPGDVVENLLPARKSHAEKICPTSL